MRTFPDISWYQQGLILAQLKAAGYDTVSLRASAGASFRDTAFPGWWQQAAALGLRRIAYHFQYENSPAVEAANFLGAVDAAGGWRTGDLAMDDLETLGDPNPGSGCGRALSWHELIHARQPGIGQLGYGNAWYLQDGGYTPDRLPNVGVVIAAYPVNGPFSPADNARPALPAGWGHACAWQFTDQARVPGWGSAVDMNAITCPTGFAHLSPHSDPASLADLPGSKWPTIDPAVAATHPANVAVMRRLLTHAGFPDLDDGRPLDLIDADRIGKLQAAHGLSRDGLFGAQSLYAALGIRQSSPALSAWPTLTPSVALTHPYQLGAARTLLNRVSMWDVDDGRPYSDSDAGAVREYQTQLNFYSKRIVVPASGAVDPVTITYLLGCHL